MATLDPVWASWTHASTTASASVGTWTITATDNTASLYTLYDPSWRTWFEWQSGREARDAAARERAVQELAAMQQRSRDLAAARAAAQARALKLLLKCLTPEERQCWERYEFFDVVGSDGNLYRIHAGTAGNVRLLVADAAGRLTSQGSYCCHPAGLPEADTVLAQALWLKHDAPHFVRIANWTPSAPARRAVPGVTATDPRQYFNAQEPRGLLLPA